ncbi:C40 family peptidase [Candidatus Nomurabacteria bacterium]|nr:C40 family peptidase [Candidatus Nomurabacteria bacterium]
MKKSFSLSTILATTFFALCVFFVQTPHTHAACSITSAKFEPSGLQQDVNWFKDSSKPIVKVHVVSTGCEGQTIELSIVGNDQLTPDDDVFGFDNRQFTIPQSGKLTVITKAGEDECEIDTNVFDYSIGNADCEYYLNIVGADDYNSNGETEGELAFECDDACDENWTYRKSGDTDTITIDGSGDITNEQLSSNTYTFLAPLPGLSEVTGNEGVANFIERLFIIMISLAGVLAVLSLIFAGFQYITTGVFSVKTSAKERIWNSILGLLLALGAFIILNTINPDLVNNLGLNIETVTLTTPGDTEDPLISNFQPLSGMVCPGNGGKAQIPTIANSFVNKVTYKMGGKGSGNGSTIFLDCSGFVSQVIKCAGGSDQGGTINIFSGNGVENVVTITNTTVNGVALQPGDLLGWKVGSTEPFGHVVIYVGNGKVMDSHGPANITNKAIGTLDSTYYKNQDGSSRIKFIRRTTLN